MQARGWEILPPINLSILVDDVHKDLAQVDGRGPGGKGFYCVLLSKCTQRTI